MARGPRSQRRRDRPNSPLPVHTVWVEGARNDAWDELWRRLLAAVVRRLEEDAVNEGVGGEYHLERRNPCNDSPADG
jgi:hypothetical protein